MILFLGPETMVLIDTLLCGASISIESTIDRFNLIASLSYI